MRKFQQLSEYDYEDFESLDNVEKLSYVLESEVLKSMFDELVGLVKEYIVDVWKIRKRNLYIGDLGSGLQLHTHLERKMVSSFRMVNLVRMVSLVKMASLVRVRNLVRMQKFKCKQLHSRLWVCGKCQWYHGSNNYEYYYYYSIAKM